METSETDRAWLKARRAAKIDQARDASTSEAYGITVDQVDGRTRLVWDFDSETFGTLMGLHQLRDVLLVDMEADLVAACRAEGVSWEEIGWTLGMTGSSVRKRHLPGDVQVRRHLVAALGGRPARAAVTTRSAPSRGSWGRSGRRGSRLLRGPALDEGS